MTLDVFLAGMIVTVRCAIDEQTAARLSAFAERGELPAGGEEQLLFCAATVGTLEFARAGTVHVPDALRRARRWITKQKRRGYRGATLRELLDAVAGKVPA